MCYNVQVNTCNNWIWKDHWAVMQSVLFIFMDLFVGVHESSKPAAVPAGGQKPDVSNGRQQGWETVCRWNQKTQRHFYQQ